MFRLAISILWRLSVRVVTLSVGISCCVTTMESLLMSAMRQASLEASLALVLVWPLAMLIKMDGLMCTSRMIFLNAITSTSISGTERSRNNLHTLSRVSVCLPWEPTWPISTMIHGPIFLLPICCRLRMTGSNPSLHFTIGIFTNTMLRMVIITNLCETVFS